MRCRPGNARAIKWTNAPVPHQGRAWRSCDRGGVALRPASGLHHVSRTIDRSLVHGTLHEMATASCARTPPKPERPERSRGKIEGERTAVHVKNSGQARNRRRVSGPRGRCLFLALLVQQGAANVSELRHETKARNAVFLELTARFRK